MSQTSRSASEVIDERMRSWPLELIVPLDWVTSDDTGPLLSRWADIAVGDLPVAVQALALRAQTTWQSLARAMIKPEAVESAAAAFINALEDRLASRWGERDAAITMARCGLTSVEIPTLEELGRTSGLTRERVRNVVRDAHQEVGAEITEHPALALVIAAWFELNRGQPMFVDDLAIPGSPIARTIVLAATALRLPALPNPLTGWVAREAERRALGAILSEIDSLLRGTASLVEIESRIQERFPHCESVLDISETLRLLSERLDFGSAIGGRIEIGHRLHLQRVAQKIATYLQRRAVSIEPHELARFIRKGVPPFEPFHRALVEADWLIYCARANSDLLQVLAGGAIALAPNLAHLRPTGKVGMLHAIVAKHGEPIRMVELCDRAAKFGITRNEVGTYIHGGRAACFFLLKRGIVGLVGRDELADGSQYQAALPSSGPRVRVGREIGFDQVGLAADVTVRRSIREQGFGLPWPFSVVYFSNRPRLLVDGSPSRIEIRSNGDLDVQELTPASRVRLRLVVAGDTHQLQIAVNVSDPIATLGELREANNYPLGLPSEADRPAWVRRALGNMGDGIPTLEAALALMPSAMVPKRRLRAIHAFVALGLIKRGPSGWRSVADHRLPSRLGAAFAAMVDDPTCYPVLTPEEQSAVGWLVRATWLVPNIGWSRVRPNDLADLGADEEDEGVASVVPTSPRETALMRIVEAGHVADDLRKHPGNVDPLAATKSVARRLLVALGYTAYGAIQEIDGDNLAELLLVRSTHDTKPSALWLMLPVGMPILDQHIESVRKQARHHSASTALVTNGIHIRGVGDGSGFKLDLLTLGKHQDKFELLVAIAADPGALATAHEGIRSGDNAS